MGPCLLHTSMDTASATDLGGFDGSLSSAHFYLWTLQFVRPFSAQGVPKLPVVRELDVQPTRTQPCGGQNWKMLTWLGGGICDNSVCGLFNAHELSGPLLDPQDGSKEERYFVGNLWRLSLFQKDDSASKVDAESAEEVQARERVAMEEIRSDFRSAKLLSLTVHRIQ